MKRREFLTASLAGMLARPRPRHRSRQAQEWRFSLDDALRWSLARAGEPPLISRETIAVELDGGPAALLGDLEELRQVRSETRAGAVTLVVGRRETVEVAVQFEDGARPRIVVRVRGLDLPRDLLAVRLAQGVPLAGRVAWINGYDSQSRCQVVRGTGAARGHWQLALVNGAPAQRRIGAPSLAMVFGESDGSDGEFRVGGGRVAAVSRFGHRAVSAAHPPVAASLTILPGGDPFEQLAGQAALARGPLPREVPAGWCSCQVQGLTEDAVLANLEAARSRLGPGSFGLILLDEGYQRSAGDWEMNERFPHGHGWLTDRIHAAGFRAGLYLAPFAVTERSGIPAAHPEWLELGDDGSPLALHERPQWGGPVYRLDAARRAVQDYLRDLARHASQEWGYDVLELDLLDCGARETRPERGASPHEALRAGLRALREGAGNAFLLGSDAPQQHSLGLLDGMSTGGDAEAGWVGIVSAARAASLREHLSARAWYNWPGPLRHGSPLTTEEARAWASAVALWGGIAVAAGSLTELSEERLEILRRCAPPVPLPAGAPYLALDNRGTSGPGTATRDGAPPWIAVRVRDDWWMVAAVNWDAEPRRMSASLASLGVSGRVAAYDVWAEARRADIAGSVSLTVEPHSATVLSLRRPRRHPFVLGTTRHVVQGALDLAAETWDSRRRSLSGRSVRLDGRSYAIMIAVPPGYHPRRCGASAECSVVHQHRDARVVRLEIAGTGEEVEWEVGF